MHGKLGAWALGCSLFVCQRASWLTACQLWAEMVKAIPAFPGRTQLLELHPALWGC